MDFMNDDFGFTDEPCDRTIDVDDVDTIIPVSVHPKLIGKYREMWVNLTSNEFYEIKVNSVSGIPTLIPRHEWMSEAEYKAWKSS